MHFMRLTYWTWYLGLTHLKRAQNPFISLLGQNPLTQSLVDNEVLTISCKWLNAVMKGKNGIVISVLLVWPYDFRADWELQLLLPASGEGTKPPIGSRRKDPSSRFEVRLIANECISFLHHCKVKKSLGRTTVSWGLSIQQVWFCDLLPDM